MRVPLDQDLGKELSVLAQAEGGLWIIEELLCWAKQVPDPNFVLPPTDDVPSFRSALEIGALR